MGMLSEFKGSSIHCLCPLRDLKRVAARRESQQNGHSILKARKASAPAHAPHLRPVGDAADACFRSRPTGLYGQPRLCGVLSRQAHAVLTAGMASKARLNSELVVKPEDTSNV